MDTGFTLKQVTSVAKVHPFYNDEVEYPPSIEEVQRIVAENQHDEEIDLSVIPLTTKERLYKSIRRLAADTSPNNTYRISSYMSITGGGSGGLPMIFATDSAENRRQRAAAGALTRICKLVEPGDVILTTHITGGFYRSSDLMTEIYEVAGGTVFCAGLIPMPAVLEALDHYQANAISGDGSQMLQLSNAIGNLPPEKRSRIKIRKVFYTSEPLRKDQRDAIVAALDSPQIFSVMGSAEAGPWCVANFAITGEPVDDGVDFIYDERMTKIEILPPSVQDAGPKTDGQQVIRTAAPLPDGEKGIIIQTSLSRLRNPLLRYVTGDTGSTRPFPIENSFGISASDAKHLRILRLYGRDRRFSFKWFGEYFDFQLVKEFLQKESFGILQWQIILAPTDEAETSIEIRMFRSSIDQGKTLETKEHIEEKLKVFFVVLESLNNSYLFKVTWVQDLDGFEKSSTGSKVMNFVDRVKH